MGQITRSRAAGISYGLRLATFLLLELGYVALTTFCLYSTVILPSSFNEHQTEVKAVTTIITIIWQTVALFPILSILSNTFSSEWNYLYGKSGLLQPGKTDRVWTLTSGLWEQLKHALFAKTASMAFRVCFMASSTALLLHNVAPGAITVNSTSINERTSISIGKFRPGPLASFWQADRATSIVRLEQVESSPFPYDMDPASCIVGWPSSSYLENKDTLSYTSDSMCWSHECTWDQPVFSSLANLPISNVEGLVSSVWNTTTYEGEWDVDSVWVSDAKFTGEAAGTVVFLWRHASADLHPLSHSSFVPWERDDRWS